MSERPWSKKQRWKDRLGRWGAAILGRVTLGAVVSLVTMGFFLKIAHEVAEDETRQLDYLVLHYLKAHRDPLVYAFMTGVTWVTGGHGQPVVIAMCALGFGLAGRFWPDGLLMLLAPLGGLGLITVLKQLYHRDRPDAIFTRLGYSFPSGHSFMALVVYGLLAYLLTRGVAPGRRWAVWITAGAAVLLVGFSRMYLGEHFPSDVAAGYAAAVPWLWSCAALREQLVWSGSRRRGNLLERPRDSM